MEATGGVKSCRPCVVANAAVAVVVAVVPLVIVAARDERGAVVAAAGWMVVVLAYAARRLGMWGYLPSAPTLARLTRLNRVVGADRTASRTIPTLTEDGGGFAAATTSPNREGRRVRTDTSRAERRLP